MHPSLALFGDLSTWSLTATLGTLIAVVVGMKAGRGLLPTRLLVELAVVVVTGGWLSAKVGHVLFEARGHALPGGRVADGVVDLLRADPWHWARLLEPGFVQFAGLMGAVGLGVLFLVRQGEGRAVPGIADAAAVAVAGGVGLGRLGCFLGGCCHGKATDVAWAVRFPADHATGGAPVHPTQLYDAAVALAALVVWWVLRRRHTRAGVAAVAVAAIVLSGRVLTEFVRADLDRGTIGPLSTSQALGLLGLLLLLAVAVTMRFRRNDDVGAAQP